MNLKDLYFAILLENLIKKLNKGDMTFKKMEKGGNCNFDNFSY